VITSTTKARKIVNHFELAAPMPMNALKLRVQYVQCVASSNHTISVILCIVSAAQV
jgi:hypothetical protein